MATVEQKKKFISEVKPYAEKAGSQLNINPDYIVAHWAHETGYGTNSGYKNNNLAGYMAYPNSPYGINGKKFSNLNEFTETYVSLLKNKRYNQIFNAQDSTGFAKALKAGGYATDPNYSNANTWIEAFELSSGIKSNITTNTTPTTEEVFEEEIPNIIKNPSEFFGYLGNKIKFYVFMFILLILLLFLLYFVFIKDSSIGEGLESVSKAIITKGVMN